MVRPYLFGVRYSVYFSKSFLPGAGMYTVTLYKVGVHFR